MRLRDPELILANIVLVPVVSGPLNLPTEVFRNIFKDAEVQLLQPVQHLQITSLREQVRVLLGGGRFEFEDRASVDSPRQRVAEVARMFADVVCSRGVSSFAAYGFNFDIAFDVPGSLLPSEMVRDRFVRVEELEKRGSITIAGAGVRLYFDVGPAKCDLRIEPRSNDRTSARFWSHITFHFADLQNGELPDKATLMSDFTGKFVQFTDLLERLLPTS